MSAWRQRAIELFPDLREDFEDSDTTIYDVFCELLPRVREAHARDDNEELRRIYSYAEWCMHQDAHDIWNAAGVAFYEHLVDDPLTFAAIPSWVPPDVFMSVSGLFEARLESDDYRRLCEVYSAKHGLIEIAQPRVSTVIDGTDDWHI